MIDVESDINEDESPNGSVTTLNNDGTIDSKTLEVGAVDDESDGPRFDPLAAVAAALNGEPTEFEDQVKLGIADRLQTAIERKRDEVAQAIFGPTDQEVEADDNDAEDEEVEKDDEEDKPEE